MYQSPGTKLETSDPAKWDRLSRSYDEVISHSSKRAAARLIALANDMRPLSGQNVNTIDLGTGTGSLALTLAASYPNAPVLATDISPGMLEKLCASPGNVGQNLATQLADMRSPIGGEIKEGAFSHVFSTMALQVIPTPLEALREWAKLLQPDGVVAIAGWDFDEVSGPHAIWEEAVQTVEPEFKDKNFVPPGHWTGLRQVKEGMEAVGFRYVQTEVYDIAINVGTEGFMHFFWESDNPMPVNRRGRYKGSDLDKVKAEMERLLEDKYDHGRRIPLYAVLAVGRKPR